MVPQNAKSFWQTNGHALGKQIHYYKTLLFTAVCGVTDN